MASIYAWFDWEDNTTSVNPLGIIEEPRKPIETYKAGEKVRAKLPKYGFWNGVIVEIGDKKELTKNMDARQKMEADAASSNDGGDNEQSKETVTDDENQTEKQLTKKAKSAQKRGAAEQEKVEEKAKKKRDEEVKLSAKKQQLETIIKERREQQTPRDTVNAGSSRERDNWYFPNSNPPYSYVADLNAPLPDAPDLQLQPLLSVRELQQKNQQLEEENCRLQHQIAKEREENERYKRDQLDQLEQLRKENEDLKKQAGRMDEQTETRQTNIGLDITPRKVKFLKQLTNALEQQQPPEATPTRTRHQQPLDDTSVLVLEPFGTSTPASSTDTMASHNQETPPSALRGLSFDESAGRDGYHWEESITNTGLKKVRLVNGIDVFLTQGQLSHALES